MSDEDLVKYFIERTDERLAEMDKKIDELLSFKWQIVGGSVVISLIINFIIDRLIK